MISVTHNTSVTNLKFAINSTRSKMKLQQPMYPTYSNKAKEEIWTFGARNVYYMRYACDYRTTDICWSGDRSTSY